MSIRTLPWPAGTPCWVDLATSDAPAAKALYASVLGWTWLASRPEFNHYANAQRDGHMTAGLVPMADAPQAWTVYVSSDDLAATVAAITTAGGTVVAGPHPVGDLGSMVVALDPNGASFGVWQHGTFIGAEIVNQPGSLVWEDLRATDPAAARACYTTFAGPDGVPLGGLGEAPPGVPTGWLPYFLVPDADVAAATTTEAGGGVLAPAFDTPWGRMVTLADTTGAAFAVMGGSGDGTPDRADQAG